MKDFYEELWRRLPEHLDPIELARREAFLRSEIRRGDRVLDLGCGEGHFTAVLARQGAVAVGLEVAEAALARARSRHPQLDFRLTPIDGPLPLEDCSVEVVFSSEVIEHVVDTARWMSEVRRVLVPGGRVLITTPAHPRLAIALFGLERYADPLGDHFHLYTRRSLTRLLGEFGFGDVRVRPVGGAPLLRRMLIARGAR